MITKSTAKRGKQHHASPRNVLKEKERNRRGSNCVTCHSSPSKNRVTRACLACEGIRFFRLKFLVSLGRWNKKLELKKPDHRPGTDKVEPETKRKLQVTTALCYFYCMYSCTGSWFAINKLDVKKSCFHWWTLQWASVKGRGGGVATGSPVRTSRGGSTT